jgi:predicted O-linked N-acetylglucosamine transferase (SPINDLY family)
MCLRLLASGPKLRLVKAGGALEIAPSDLAEAERLLREGLLSEAEQACRAVLAGRESAPALHLLGNVLLRLGRRAEAQAAYEDAVRLDPSQSRTHNNLGNLRLEAGDLAGAVASYRRALAGAQPTAAVRGNLARALVRAGAAAEARQLFEALAAEDPAEVRHQVGLAQALRAEGRADAALAALSTAFARFPDEPRLTGEQGAALLDLGRSDAALPFLERALAALPDDRGLATSYARALHDLGELSRARDLLARLADIEAPDPDAATAFAAVLFELGEHSRAAAVLERAAVCAPGDASLRLSSSRLFHLDHVETDAGTLLREHARWGAAVAALHGPAAPTRGARTRAGKPKIALVSSDLRQHVVPRFLLGLLGELAVESELVLVSTAARSDTMTDSLAKRFRLLDLGRADRETFRRALEAERPDVVCELGGHTGDDLVSLHPRLAPVQALYLGYPGTSGLESIDLRITDRWVDPPGEDQAYVEAPLRLERTSWAYAPPSYFPPAAPVRTGPPRFGCFSRLAKYGPTQIDLFAAVLRAAPGSTLLLRARPFGDAHVRAELESRLDAAGIGGRVELRAWAGDLAAAQAEYAEVDVVLDTFPYHGTTTTCDALVAGRPVVSLRGAQPAARVSSSLLAAVGCEHLVATDAAGYLEQAARLVEDAAERKRLAEALPRAVEAGPLGDPRGLGRAILEGLRRALDAT